MRDARVLIVAESASARFGGEAALPLHYFRVLRKLGRPVWLLTHARNRDELTALFPGEARIRYVDDTRFHRVMWKIGRRMPARISHFTAGFASRIATQLAQRRLARRLIADEAIDVVHQPMPVSPREPSLLYDMTVPVIVGPMNGGMNFPPGFAMHSRRFERSFIGLGRASANVFNAWLPGKKQAAMLLVANARTRDALPSGIHARVVELVENGVDLSLWTPDARAAAAAPRPTGFIFVGRLLALKGVDYLLRAFQRASAHSPMHLSIVGEGTERASLEALADQLGLRAAPSRGAGGVQFEGWLDQTECVARMRDADALVLPSLHECGGAVVLEAMSLGKPVVATAWGGPADYVDATCGILVQPTDPDAFETGLADALVRLASSAAERDRMGSAGRAKVVREYDWDVKVARMIEHYDAVTANRR